MVLAKYRKRNALAIDMLKEANPCSVCGESCPVVIDFHHIDPATKVRNVSDYAKATYGLEVMAEEVAKCTPLCSNCHRKYHAGLIEIPGTPAVIPDSFYTLAPRKRLRETDIPEIIALRQSGLLWPQVAEAMGVTDRSLAGFRRRRNFLK